MTSRGVLLVHTSAEMYGADNACLLLAAGLSRRGRRVTVVLPYQGPLRQALEAVGVDVVIAPVGAVRRVFTLSGWLRFLVVDLPTSVFKIRSLSRRHDMVHVNTSVAVGAILGAWSARRPVVVHLRESYAGSDRAWRVYGRLLHRCSSLVIAVSHWIDGEAAAAGIVRRRVVYDAAARLPEVSANIAAVEVASVGRLNECKGHLVLVEAAAELRRRGLHVPVRIVGGVYPGGEKYRDEIEARIRDLDVSDLVQLVGETDDIDKYLESASIFVLATTRPEAFGIALIEAMAAGLACIATAAGGPLEIIDPEINGMLVEPGDSVALADAIEDLARDSVKRKRLGDQAALDVRERFGADKVVSAVDALHSELLAR